MSSGGSKQRVVVTNRKALRDYFIEDRLEAGLVLKGTEVKSLREGRVELADGYVVVEGGEAWLVNTHISPWPQATYFNHEPRRRRKLLLHRHQIARLRSLLEIRGYTAVPLKIYFNERNRAKVEIGLARGKKKVDKRATIKERDEQRQRLRET
ncbi:MAG: SsrA-binding protein SmpB [Deltaproteobacteria bacterium]|nr:MAG: SsrA-binding protein SmpB [Deltaproteobacteria bacterium]